MLHLRSKRDDTSHKDESRGDLVRLFVRLLPAFSDLLSNTNDVRVGHVVIVVIEIEILVPERSPHS